MYKKIVLTSFTFIFLSITASQKTESLGILDLSLSSTEDEAFEEMDTSISCLENGDRTPISIATTTSNKTDDVLITQYFYEKQHKAAQVSIYFKADPLSKTPRLKFICSQLFCLNHHQQNFLSLIERESKVSGFSKTFHETTFPEALNTREITTTIDFKKSEKECTKVITTTLKNSDKLISTYLYRDAYKAHKDQDYWKYRTYAAFVRFEGLSTNKNKLLCLQLMHLNHHMHHFLSKISRDNSQLDQKRLHEMYMKASGHISISDPKMKKEHVIENA